MPENVAPHAHCQICGKAIPVSEPFCSDECKQKFTAMMKKRKLMVYAMYALIAIIIVIILFSG